MQNIPENIKNLIQKWQTRSLSVEERALLNKWYNEELPEEMYWYGDEEHGLKDRLFEGINLELGSNITNRTTNRSVQHTIIALSAIAAAFVIFFAVNRTLWYSPAKIEIISVEHNSTSEVRRIILPDQSIVWLKGKSKLFYPKTFMDNMREVELTGEGLFEITKDANRPFVIRAGHYTTQVLGTSFNLKVDERSGTVELAVLTGAVEVSKRDGIIGRGKSIKILANESFRATDQEWTKPIRATPVENISALTAGTQYDMKFISVPVEEIMNRFEAKYNVTFEGYTGEYRSCLVTADLTDQSMETSLKLLSLAINANFTIKDKKIKLTGGGCF
ncbi:FecR family protein [Sphingobacterium sp. MYb388]|uniref:FecR family protein n=1 Tax=Sphingobacterium sp. MYb388 TaxID=2745437 RepID=UPI0030B30F01